MKHNNMNCVQIENFLKYSLTRNPFEYRLVESDLSVVVSVIMLGIRNVDVCIRAYTNAILSVRTGIRDTVSRPCGRVRRL